MSASSANPLPKGPASGEAPRPAWHALSSSDVLAELRVEPARGLAPLEVDERRARVGWNALPEPERPGAFRRFALQFADPLVLALLVAALVALAVAVFGSEHAGSGWLARFGDAIAIALIVLLNALLGFAQESRAGRALEALEQLSAPTARVRRRATSQTVPARDLVPGDLVLLEAGDRVPADVRWIDAHGLFVEEAALTGESVPLEKLASRVVGVDTSVADRCNMAFVGTSVTRGHGEAVVVGTGHDTELGRIGALIGTNVREPTPLEERIATLGRRILGICLAISALLFALGAIRGEQSWSLLLLTSVSLAVAAIPEGLPAITTITLALGMQRMARRGAIVRRLPAVETLGSATVICTDKTGTLTENRMRVTVLDTIEARHEIPDAPPPRLAPDLEALLASAVICNTAEISDGERSGDPLELALIEAAAAWGVSRSSALAGGRVERVVPFDSESQSMTVWTTTPDGRRVAHLKGSPERIVELSTHVLVPSGSRALSAEDRRRLLDVVARRADEGLRVLAMAREESGAGDAMSGACFLGFAAMYDAPRAGVAESIARCHAAGIEVIMITGDHPGTALSIARKVGIADERAGAVSGRELEALGDDELRQRLSTARVFARVVPEQKLRIVTALRQRGHVVAMTGDGVNDAPALERAQIGVAMGRGGTEVARQAADMVLADDDFTTIVGAVAEGRSIFSNIRKVVFFLASSNAGLVFAVLAGIPLAGVPELTPLQLLWINLVTNGLPALALGVDPPHDDAMSRPPRPIDHGIFTGRDALGVLYVGCVMACAALFCAGGWDAWVGLELPPASETQRRTMAFAVLALSPLVHAFNSRNGHLSVFTPGRPSNRLLWLAVVVSFSLQALAVLVPSLRPVFHTTELDSGHWLLVIGLSLSPLPAVELAKWLDRILSRQRTRTLPL